MDFNISNEANALRKSGQYEKALKLYKTINIKNTFVVSGMSYCYRRLSQPKQGVNLINNYISKNNIDIKNEKWLKTEFIWSYIQYYLNEKYTDKEFAINMANLVVDLENNNEIIINKIKKVLCTDEVIKKYPKQLKNLVEKIDGSKDNYKITKIKIKKHLLQDSNINTCIYYTLLLKKIKILLELQEYDEILNIYSTIKQVLDDRHLDRAKAKALEGLGRYDEAIDILKKINIRFGKQYYVYMDIGENYILMNNIEKALVSYYTAFDLCHEEKFMLTGLYKVSNLLLNIDKNLSRKHMDLLVLIRKNEGWKIKNNEIELLEKLSDYKENIDYTSLKKELKYLWKKKVNEGKEVYKGVVDKVLDTGNGFIKYGEDNRIFFKKDKKNKFNVGDKVVFYIEDSYDKKKEEYSKRATQLKCKK